MRTIYNGHANESGVYVITNQVKLRYYVGSAKRFKQRYSEHLRSLRKGTHHNKFLQNDFNRCGEAAFVFEVLEVVEGDQAARLLVEQQHLDSLHDSQDDCYNFKKETVASSRSCFSKTPEETRKLISENSRRMWDDAEWREKRIAETRSEDFRRSQSEKQKRVARNPKNGNSSYAMRKRFSDKEYRENFSEALKSAWGKDDGSRRRTASERGKEAYQANKEAMTAAHVDTLSKVYTLVSPDGVVYTFKNMAKFCREHSIPYNANIYQLFTNPTKHRTHFGWTTHRS